MDVIFFFASDFAHELLTGDIVMTAEQLIFFSAPLSLTVAKRLQQRLIYHVGYQATSRRVRWLDGGANIAPVEQMEIAKAAKQQKSA